MTTITKLKLLINILIHYQRIIHSIEQTYSQRLIRLLFGMQVAIVSNLLLYFTCNDSNVCPLTQQFSKSIEHSIDESLINEFTHAEKFPSPFCQTDRVHNTIEERVNPHRKVRWN